MGITTRIKDELSGVQIPSIAARCAEVTTLLRFVDALRVIDGRMIITARLDNGHAGRRLFKDIHELYGYTARTRAVGGKTASTSESYVLTVIDNSDELARRTGLLDRCGRPVIGIPAHVVGGSVADAEAAWRGAFLARGLIRQRVNGTRKLEILCPSLEAAMALTGGARRMDIPAQSRDNGTNVSVQLRGAAVAEMLTRLGAHRIVQTLEQEDVARKDRPAAGSLIAHGSFIAANKQRSSTAAAETIRRVERAFEILDPTDPSTLIAAGQLRLAHPEASLEELAQLADPPTSKDTMAGRLRRLLLKADQHAAALGIPNTEAAPRRPLRAVPSQGSAAGW